MYVFCRLLADICLQTYLNCNPLGGISIMQKLDEMCMHDPLIHVAIQNV